MDSVAHHAKLIANVRNKIHVVHAYQDILMIQHLKIVYNAQSLRVQLMLDVLSVVFKLYRLHLFVLPVHLYQIHIY
jgi:hypothetical protein